MKWILCSNTAYMPLKKCGIQTFTPCEQLKSTGISYIFFSGRIQDRTIGLPSPTDNWTSNFA